ncbi:MAG: Cd(II)/Pb(II)-responsive transcriptional regulator [Betaproteobacteria bacterium]|nr:Cd(II)/Pb(II)-responsive transcriptional regulator [Betaproteobacteria bacterium]
MLIGELAKRTGCDRETIRYYEREGILEQPPRTAGGYRIYTADQLGQVIFIRHCRSLGMSLMEIKALQRFQAKPDAGCAEINALIDRQIDAVRRQLDGLQLLEKRLLALRARCHGAQPAAQCGIWQSLLTAATGGKCPCHAEHGDFLAGEAQGGTDSPL